MSRKATTASSSYSTSAGLSRATMRQNRQSSTGPPSAPAIIAERHIAIAEGVPDGNVSEVQAQDQEERQPREARLHVVPQELPRPPRPAEDPSLAPAPPPARPPPPPPPPPPRPRPAAPPAGGRAGGGGARPAPPPSAAQARKASPS